MNSHTKIIPVRLTGRSAGTEELTFAVDPSDLHLPAEFATPLHVALHLDISNEQVVLRITTRGEAVFPCDRCLEPVHVPLDTQQYLVYTNKAEDTGSADTDDIRPIDHTEPVVDLADDVRDAVLLCIPMRKTCGEDNFGNPLCRDPIPGHLDADAQKTTDPRWDVLKTLKL